jgi:hypothetical protein
LPIPFEGTEPVRFRDEGKAVQALVAPTALLFEPPRVLVFSDMDIIFREPGLEIMGQPLIRGVAPQMRDQTALS